MQGATAAAVPMLVTAGVLVGDAVERLRGCAAGLGLG